MKVDPSLAGRLREQEERFGPSSRRVLDLTCGRGDGVHLWDVQGNRCLDFLAERSPVGHIHTRLAAALVEQGLRLASASGALRHDRRPPFLEKVCKLTGYETALALDSEAAGRGAALSAAGAWARNQGLAPGRAEVLALGGAGERGYADPFDRGGDLPRLRRLPWGDLAAVEASLGPDICALLVEPVPGPEAGPAPRGFLKALRDRSEAAGLLLLADETRSGLGRTGRLCAFEHEGIRPDGLILGSALTGGMLPMGAFLASRTLMDLAFGAQPPSANLGNPLACAVACAALDVLVEDHLADRSAELGAYFLARLRALDSPVIEAIHGLGLWAAIEVREGEAPERCRALALEGLLCAAPSGRVLVLAPPLVITRDQLDGALEKLERVFAR